MAKLTTVVHGPNVQMMYNTCITTYSRDLRRQKDLTNRQFTSKLDAFKQTLRTGSYSDLVEWYQIAMG